MKIYMTLSCAILLTISLSFGQKMTYIGVEGAVTSDKFEVFDPCETITNTNLITGSWGFSVGQQVHKNVLIESGLIWKYYDQGHETLHYEYPLGPSAGTSDAFYAFQIPLRLISRINLSENKLFLNTTLGYHLGINRDYGNDFVYNPNYSSVIVVADQVVGNDTIKNVRPVESKHLRKTFGLIEAGLGLEYVVGNGFFVGLSASYFVGLDNVYREYMSTGISNGVTSCSSDNAIGVSKGSYSNLRLTLKYNIGRFWIKESN